MTPTSPLRPFLTTSSSLRIDSVCVRSAQVVAKVIDVDVDVDEEHEKRASWLYASGWERKRAILAAKKHADCRRRIPNHERGLVAPFVRGLALIDHNPNRVKKISDRRRRPSSA